MAETLRDLLIQRAARLQERPALTVPEWGILSYAQLRNRAEGVALGLLAGGGEGPVFSATGSAWDWAAELGAAAAGLIWDPSGRPVPPEVLGGARFNHEEGRGPYHALEQVVQTRTPFVPGLDHGEVMARLRRLNVKLGWDHTSQVELPLAHLGERPVRAALWSTLYAGAHAVLLAAQPGAPGFLARFRQAPAPWDPAPFFGLWQG
jgi:hypothetical protein